jgi:2-aminoadipate transaminase
VRRHGEESDERELAVLDASQFGTLILTMMNDPVLNEGSEVPLYRQLSDAILHQIQNGEIQPGDRLPPTRELAARLNLNRTTVSAAYAALEEKGFIRGHVGRGSFVTGVPHPAASMAGLDWEAILPRSHTPGTLAQPAELSFAASRPDHEGFPMAQFRRLAKEVIDSPGAREILQLGSPFGYGPLRNYLLEQARQEGTARAGDDVIITNGCQQALDLLARALASRGEAIVVEDPVYRGLRKVFECTGVAIVPAPVGEHGVDPALLNALLVRYKPRAVALTPSFQNPTGASIPAANRAAIVESVVRAGAVLIESDIYSELRYEGQPAPTLKRLDESGNTILLRSYSKVSFPGLRVGWVIAPRPVIQCLAEFKQVSDLHSDHLAQAVLFHFANSGEMERHIRRRRESGAERLDATLSACSRYLPPGARFTRPEGGLNVWVELPAPLDAHELLMRAQEQGVNFLPGTYFSEGHAHSRFLRLSFGGLTPKDIERGIRIIGGIANKELNSVAQEAFEPAPALV